jgi:uncharacterized protein
MSRHEISFRLFQSHNLKWTKNCTIAEYYYRDKDMKEIDLLILRDNVIYPIEIKKTSAPKKDVIQNFNVLKKFNMTIGSGCVVCLSHTLLPISSTVNAFPVYAL